MVALVHGYRPAGLVWLRMLRRAGDEIEGGGGRRIVEGRVWADLR
ncbi:hypothetical protein [Kribbella sp. NBC_00359]